MHMSEGTFSHVATNFAVNLILNPKSILVLLNLDMPSFAYSVDPDQLASEEANGSGSALFVIKYVNLYQRARSTDLIGWKLEMGVAS